MNRAEASRAGMNPAAVAERVFLVLLFLGLSACAAPSPSPPAGAPVDVPLGSVIAGLEFKDIRALRRSLAELGDHEAIVLVFTTTRCPLVQRYLPVLDALEARYRAHGVQFVAVNVGFDDSVRDMAAQALEAGARYPFVKDETGACARALGVQRTPEVAVLDRARRLVYRGRIDDQYRLGGALPEPRRHDLAEALDDLLAGRPVRVASTPADGCQITYSTPTPESGPQPTYHEHVLPLVQAHCAPCHRSGGEAPFSLVSYADVRRHGAMIAEVVRDERMPPWFANPRYGTFQNDRSLPDEARRTILDWVRTGMAAGDPAAAGTAPRIVAPRAAAPRTAAPRTAAPRTVASGDAASSDAISGDAAGRIAVPGQPEDWVNARISDLAAHPTGGWAIGTPDLVIEMSVDDQIPATGLVPYRYVALPHVFIGETWVEAFEIRPDHRAVVHHANLGFGAPGHRPGRSTFITGYVPGGQAMNLARFDNDVAFRLPALSVLGLQVHYVTTGRPERCRISVGVRFKRGIVRKELRYNLADPRRFAIPPGHPAYPIRDSFTVTDDVSILGLFAHMHLRGRDVTFRAILPDGASETLLQVPSYDFNWQIAYEIAPGAKRLLAGTRVEVLAHFDNSVFNPFNPDPGQTVRYGPQTHDEMMNGYVFYTVDAEELALEIDPTTGWARSGTGR